jgi:hypothetical protein
MIAAKTLSRFALLLPALAMIGACTGKPSLQDASLSTRELELEEFFDGRLVAHGQFQDVFGTVRRQFVVQITGDNTEGKAQLDNFIDPEKPYPVIATTSKLMSTGVDAQTCKLIVLDQNIKSMTLFKQIIGRGTRINEHHGKTWFTILDFKRATELFADKDFDGEPVQIYEPQGDQPVEPPDNTPGTGDGQLPDDPTLPPGGVGPMTITMLLVNTLESAQRALSAKQ